MNIKIDGNEYPVDEAQLTVKDVLKLGGKPENNLTDYELHRIINNTDDLIYSKFKKPKSSIKDIIPQVDNNEQFIIRIATATIYVNAQEKEWPYDEINYKDVVELAFDRFMDNPNILYTVLYFDGPKNKSEGSLVKGTTVKVKNEMKFNVTQTDKS